MKPLLHTAILLLLPFFLFAQKPQLVVPVGHTSYLKDAIISPDGKNVLTASSDRTAKLWNRDGHLLATLPGAAWEVQSVDFSPDGNYLLTCSRDALRLWNRDGSLKEAFPSNLTYTYATFSPDGKHIAAGSEEGKIVVWNFKKQAVWLQKVYDKAVKQVAYSPDGKLLAAIPLSYDHGSFKAWDSNYTLKHEFSTVYPLTAFMFSPNNEALLLGGSNGEVTIWELRAGTQKEFNRLHYKEIYSVAAHPAGFLTASNDGTAKLFNKDGEVQQVFRHNAAVRNVTFSKDGKEILTFSDDNEAVKVWNLRGQIIQRLNGYGADILSLAISPDGTKVLSGSANGPRIWDISDQTPLIPLYQKDIINEVGIGISSDGQRYYSAGWDGTVKIWSPDGTLKETIYSAETEIEAMSISPDGEALLLSGKQGSTIYNKLGRSPRKVASKDYRSSASAFSPSGDTILTGSSFNDARLWNAQTGKEIQVLPQAGGIDGVAFSPDGQYILTHAKNKTLKLWDREGKISWEKKGWDSFDGRAAFSSDGETVLVPNGNVVELLDMKGNTIKTLSGHKSVVNTVMFAPDEKYIYTGSRDGTIKIWDATSFTEIASLIQLGNEDWAVVTPSGLFDASPEAMRLMYYTVDGEIVALDQMKALYYQPGLLQITMGYSKGATLRDVSELRELRLYPEIEAELEGSILKIKLKEREGGMGKLAIKANGIPVIPDANPQRKTQIEINIDPFGNYFLEGEDNTISIIAHDAEGVMESAPYNIRIPPREYIGGRGGGEDQPRASFSLSTKSTPDASLYALCVGTSKYSGEVPALRYPDKDADAISRALRDAGGALFTPDSVHVRLLNTSGEEGTVYASKKNIREAILEFAGPGRAQAKDVLLLYFSGHGISYPPGPDAEFYYLTKDVVSTDLKNEEVRRNFAISVSELAEWMNEVYANKKVLILDACNSGEAIKEFTGEKSLNPSQILAMERMKDATGTFVLSGSAADKKSFEASRFGQGLLTYSLLQGMKAEGLTKEKFVDVMLLFNHAKLKVPELARSIGNIQDPQMTYPPSSQTVYLGKVTPDVKIPVAEEAKPVFVNSKIFKEDLTNLPGLESKLQEILQEESAKGIDAAVAYFDVPAYQDGFQIRSIYSVNRKEITFPGKVFHLSGGGEENLIGEFKVEGDTRKLDELVQQIIFEAVKIVDGYKKRGAGSP